ncbi:ABC-F family ATP-binding cassette domain-containing protein [Anaerosporobacter sp.]|uniref:ABC-F family ATP-binding cassette domain-containing protein n=1 Tax=Anaerosporobacter sp. TaxID=1872529 RepID=UPI00286EB5B1|nr:ATP-binding cassette domain-containing protein [Anaerosporobacter sp.]
MLQIKNLTITHKKDLRTMLEDFSLTLNDGDKAAIIGEEGNGKSTLIKLIYNPELIEDYIEYTGEIINPNNHIGYLAQELLSEDMQKTVYEYCSEEEVFFELTPKELTDIARQVGFDMERFYSDQSVATMSGGEKVKLQLARLLMKQPDLLLLDEPSNDLDIDTLEWLETFINRCKQPVLYISHDETLLENTANMIIHLEQVRRKTVSKYTVIKMGYREYYDTRIRGLEHQEQVAKKQRSDYQKQMDRYNQIQQKVEHQQNAITRQDPHGGQLLKKKMHSVKAMGKRFEREKEDFLEIPDTEDAMFIKFTNNAAMPNGKVVVDYSLEELCIEDRVLAKGIHLQIEGPKKVCIIGKNGCGKTTLMKLIAAKMLERTDIKAAYMPQNYTDLLDMEQTPVEFLTRTGDREENVRICTYLGSMKYTADEMNHKIKHLSGGQKAKLILLKMSMEGYNVLLLDEPTRNFSPLSNPVIRRTLSDYTGAIISISHDRKYLGEVCDTIYELSETGLKEQNEYGTI